MILVTDVHPEVLVLSAGVTARMERLDPLSWADFTATWEADVKAGLYWMQAALNLPLAPGGRVLVGSSGAAEQGSLLSGGYAGGKRTLWIMAKYANGVAKQEGLGIRFQAIVPLQIIEGTGIGDAGVVGAPRSTKMALLLRCGAMTDCPNTRWTTRNCPELRGDTTPKNLKVGCGLRRLRLVYGLDTIENLAEIALRDLKIMVILQIEPKLCRRAERLGEPKRGIGGNAGLFAGDAFDPRARQAASLGKSPRRHLQRNQELLPQNLSGMHGFELLGHCRVPSSSGSPQSRPPPGLPASKQSIPGIGR